MRPIAGSKYPIGGRQFGAKAFQTHEIMPKAGDMAYLCTDGYQDQFGTGQKKFMKKHFRELLHSIHALPLPEQKEILTHTLHTWMGQEHQTDDICVLGLRFGQGAQ
jgi:serine phosphatase RsbU (regulator of sigma subunit)